MVMIGLGLPVDERYERLRAGAHVLRRVAAEQSVLLAGVTALDTESTWRSAFQRRCSERIAAWRTALAIGAGALEERAAVYERLAVAPALGIDPGEPSASGAPGELFEPGTGAANRMTAEMLAGQPRLPALEPFDPHAGAGTEIRHGPVTFHVDRLAELVEQLRAAAVAARQVTADLRAAELGLAAAGVREPVTPMAVVTTMDGPGTTDVFRLGPLLVAVEAPAMAAAVERRMAAFAQSERTVRETGLFIDQVLWFVDGEPPRAAAARAIVRELAQLVGSDPARLTPARLASVTLRLEGLAPALRQAVISGLRGAPMAVLAAAAAAAPARVDLRSLRLLPAAERLGDLLLAGAPSPMVAEIARTFPGLSPERHAGVADTVLVDRAGDPVWQGGAAPSDVGQGLVGDCYLLAALIGIARADPDLLRRSLVQNPNGTVTVTLQRGGRAMPLTVTRAFPVRRRDGREFGADSENVTGHAELWPALYEKAYARLRGSYAALEIGDPGVALGHLTGLPVTSADPAEVTVADLADRLAAGQVVMVLTGGSQRTGRLVPRHAYTVLAADRRTGSVLLRNPWDQIPEDDRTHRYQWEEISADLTGVRWGPTRRDR